MTIFSQAAFQITRNCSKSSHLHQPRKCLKCNISHFANFTQLVKKLIRIILFSVTVIYSSIIQANKEWNNVIYLFSYSPLLKPNEIYGWSRTILFTQYCYAATSRTRCTLFYFHVEFDPKATKGKKDFLNF